MKLYGIVILVSAFLTVNAAGSTDGAGPVTYHISFDDLAFLKDCYVAQSRRKTPERRKLEIVPGRFGNALFLGSMPLSYDDDNMSGLDLDLVTAVIYNSGRDQLNEPFIWGAGRLHPAYGGLAFWIKGPLRLDMLFNQSASSFGRLEKELLQLRLEDDGSISAYVEDARYVRHTIRTKPVWKSDRWMHIACMWDCSSGLSLWVDGRIEASSMGSDAWWENQRPSMFHFPMARAAYDEFYLFNRPLTPDEIASLCTGNTAPERSPDRATFDRAARNRLLKAFSTDTSTLPVLKPSNGNTLVFSEITPERIQDEGISGWWLSDGRYECAWPHEYSIFTIIIGDADYHAEKADFLPPRASRVNYITLEGNLDGVSVLKGDRTGSFDPSPVISIPPDTGFFRGVTVDNIGDAELRIPFTKSWGLPPGFEGEDVQLPISGDLRLHEVGLFDVSEKPLSPKPGDRRLYIDPLPVDLVDSRYPIAMKALMPVYDRVVAGLFNLPEPGNASTITLDPMMKLNLMSEPVTGKSAWNGVVLDLWVTSPSDGNVVTVRVLDPAVPSHLWTHAEVQLRGFTGSPRHFRLALQFDPMFLVDGDRLWMQLMASEGLTIHCGGDLPSEVVMCPDIDWESAEQPYAMKTLRPCIMTYSKMFEYMPWRITRRFPDVDAPQNFNGPFDMAYPWEAVLKVNPAHRLASIYRNLVVRGHNANRFPADELPYTPEQYEVPENTPDWAAYFRRFQTFRDRIITWWRYTQRSDGQAGGGWNDDTLVFSSDHGREGGYSDMILDPNPDARILYNKVFDGFDRSNLFKEGYCRITPMDRLHNGDFVRERYKSLIYNLGDPRSATWAMEEAWHWEKPDKTPVNYGDGTAFLFGKNVLEWYWNRKRVDEPYELKDRDALIEKLRRAAGGCNDTTLWRFTEARVHTDDQSPYGSDIMHNLLNGSFGARDTSEGVYFTHVTITLGVGWIEGGGADLARLVEYSGNDGLRIRLYSFDAFDRRVTARLYRLDSGSYTVTVSADRDGDGTFETAVSNREEHLSRFGCLNFTVPPKVPSIIEVRQLRADPDPGDLPDLATSNYYLKNEETALTVTVHNIGCAPSGSFTVAVLDNSGAVLKTAEVESIGCPADFVPRHTDVVFSGLPVHDRYRVVIDPGDTVREIYEENNSAEMARK